MKFAALIMLLGLATSVEAVHLRRGGDRPQRTEGDRPERTEGDKPERPPRSDSDSEGSGSDSEGEGSDGEHEHRGPSAADIIAHCDQNDDKVASKDELLACVDK